MSLKLRNWDFSTFKAETARIARSKSVIPGEGAPGSSSPRSPGSMERPLKAGWLKKQQRSLVKNWQQRYFVLRGSTLTYHKDDKETTVQGVIQLRFSKVNELPPSSDDPGKYLFEIIPRSTGDRERCPYVLMANSQSDFDDWIRALRRVIGVPTSGVFGKSLIDTLTYEQRFGPHTVPILVQKCVEFITEHGLEEEGIFRLPGQDNAVKQFRDAFDAGERPSFPSDTDVHTVASLLKLYLRELPEPVVPWSQYQDFLDCTNLLDPSGREGWEKLEKQIALLPRANYNILRYVCRFLFEVQRHSNVNKMNVENLATVMGINLLKPQIEDPATVMKATPQIQKMMTVMIRQHETLFPISKDVHPASPSNKTEAQKNAPRSFVGWESAELGDASMSESPEEEEDADSPGPLRGDFSPKAALQESFSPCSDDWSGSPRKRTQTLPTFNCPLTGMAAKADALNRWSRISESGEEKGGTLSEDIFKILDLRTSGSFFRESNMNTKEGENRLSERRGSDNTSSSSAASQKPESNLQPARELSHQKSVDSLMANRSVQQVNSKAEQKDNPDQLEKTLKEQNKELKATVAELQAALEAERRRVAALEICLKNAERSKEEAQRRNDELQRDIQQFLVKEKKQAST
ncbi:PREDICTED: rho GTPase-activating protein 25 [Cyprinodon variegatus]|uniref:Rho GTPase activating protein 25 n=1 Tax=Cyprinodon variegatus TaxID=28743 RepID=A0A3Q2C953_CYPVA|nr:PREDICTED: rho GTPase-activating protein 25 [Cyprinodon variegatus]